KPNLCYANGRIRYRLKRVVHQHKGEKIRVVYYMAGPLEKPVRVKRTYKLPRSTSYYWEWNFNDFTCSPVKRPNGVREGQVWDMLRPEDGYLTYGPKRGKYEYQQFIY